MDYRCRLVDLLPAVLVGILVFLGLWALLLVVVWRSAPSRATAIDVVRLLPDLLRMTAGLARDPSTPRSCKVALGGLAVWLASPIDLIPEFVPVIGPLDDIVVSAIVLRWVGRRVGRGRATSALARLGWGFSGWCCGYWADRRPEDLARHRGGAHRDERAWTHNQWRGTGPGLRPGGIWNIPMFRSRPERLGGRRFRPDSGLPALSGTCARFQMAPEADL